MYAVYIDHVQENTIYLKNLLYLVANFSMCYIMLFHELPVAPFTNMV